DRRPRRRSPRRPRRLARLPRLDARRLRRAPRPELEARAARRLGAHARAAARAEPRAPGSLARPLCDPALGARRGDGRGRSAPAPLPAEMTRVAAVDLGTNSTRLLVADVEDGRVEELDRETVI